MIKLTQLKGGEFLVSPDAIISSGVFREIEGKPNYVVYQGDGIDGVTIQETPMDVARLRAAWELRFTAPELAGELPLAVGMEEGEDGPAIIFRCCVITHQLKATQAAARKPSLVERFLSHGKR